MATSFTVRPSNSEKSAFRINLTATSLLSLKLKPGDLCIIRQAESHIPAASTQKNGDSSRQHYAIAWESSGQGMKDNIVQTSRLVQEMHGLKLGDKVFVERAEENLKAAQVITLRPLSSEPMTEQRRQAWSEFAPVLLRPNWECLAVAQKLSLRIGTEGREFEVAQLKTDEGGLAGIGRFIESTTFEISDQPGDTAESTSITLKPTRFGGAKAQIKDIQDLLDQLQNPRSTLGADQGLLLYGSKGVGKSLLIDELAASGWRHVVRWQPGTKIAANFATSTLIIISRRDLPRAQGGPTRLSLDEIDRLFAAVRGKQCLIVAEARHPNDVDQDLRSANAFEVEIEIPIPSAKQRRKILNVLAGNEPVLGKDVLDSIAEQTHGYVGADLHLLVRRVLRISGERTRQALKTEQQAQANGAHSVEAVATVASQEADVQSVTAADIAAALTQIRPSALQEIFLETPKTRWTDIGGQYTSKMLLMNAVTRPLNLAPQMARLGLDPKKGVLLYGPPGCSKTLLVRALAREAGLNFLAVKGAELISMYVGESERAMREVFRKARAAAPSIIFFDEIDAIASSRGGADSGSSGSKDLNVLTTLLNEMDGFETLTGVFVVAATNKPGSIDPALMRPGRFDDIIYIPPPDEDARKEIFTKRFSGSSYEATARGVEEDAWYFARKTEGYSGAEVVRICSKAAEMALDNERDYYRFQDVEEAITLTPRNLTVEMLREFAEWGEKRMSGV